MTGPTPRDRATGRPVSLRFRNADPRLADPESFICQLVERALSRPVKVVSHPREPVDLQFTSVQVPMGARLQGHLLAATARGLRGKVSIQDGRWSRENPQPRGAARRHIWFTGENVRPPVGDWDAYLSFDLDPMGGKNAYVPLWWYSVGLLGEPVSDFSTVAPEVSYLMASRTVEGCRDKFACAFLNNPHPMRLRAIEQLSRIGQVDVFGSAVGRPVRDKWTISRNYRFSLCFENDLYPGYVTEKPFDAWACETVPLWWGMDSAAYLNEESMLNLVDFGTLDHWCEAVSQVNEDVNRWHSMVSAPLLRRIPDLQPAMDLIRGLF